MPAKPAHADIFWRFLRLGLTSFGGPVAHLGYFRREFVESAKWLGDAEYGEIVALCSVLPGPTSSQVGISLGALRGGALGGFLAWLGFTTPSAVALGLLGTAVAAGGPAIAVTPWITGAIGGLTAAAAAVVAFAVASMAQRLAATAPTRAIAAGACALALAAYRFAPHLVWAPLVAGGVAGALAIRDAAGLPPADLNVRVPRTAGWAAFGLLAVGLVALPAVAKASPGLALFSTFFQAGALVFGGGHAVLPFLESLVRNGAIPPGAFFAGYGAAQMVPGPLFTFAAFAGAVRRDVPNGALGALIATVGIFAPSFLLLCAAIPVWSSLRGRPRAAAVLAGLNAAVVGLLAAVFVDPIARTILVSPAAIGLALAAFAALARSTLPAWAIVAAAAVAGAALKLLFSQP